MVIESDEATAATLEDIREIISWNQLEGNQIYDAIYDMSDSLFGLTNVNAQSNVNTLAQSTALIVKSDADSLSVSDSVSALGNGSIITARIGENEEEMTYEYDLDNPPVLSGYAKKLRKCSNQVDTDIAPRLIVPDGKRCLQ